MNKKFKLDSLLRFKKFKEHGIKVELGNINREIQKTKDEISELEDHVKEFHTFQRNMRPDKTVTITFFRFFSEYIKAKKENIKNKEVLLSSLEKKYSNKIQDMKIAMGETKVVDNLKTRQMMKYKKKLENKRQEEIEESMKRRLYYLKSIKGD